MIPIPIRDAAEAMGATGGGSVEGQVILRVTTDSRTVRPGDLFFALRGERTDGHRFLADAEANGAVACVVERGRKDISGNAPLLAVDDPVRALGRLGAYYRRRLLPPGTIVVGITGSNGKTTTKFMLDHILSATLPGRASPKSFNNHLGVPLTLLSAEAQDRFVLVEIGSNTPGEVAALAELASPCAGVITSVGEAHLEGFGELEDVAREKASLLRYIRGGGLAVVNVDAHAIRPFLRETHDVLYTSVGFDQWAERRIVLLEAAPARTTFLLEGRYRIELNFPGAHHAANAAAAFYVARWFGLEPREILRQLSTFVPPEGRTRTIDANGIRIVDDAYNANPTSMAAAVRALSRADSARRVFVMGDMLELGGHTARAHASVAGEAIRIGIEVVVGVGPAAAEALSAARAAARPSTQVVGCADADAANQVLDALLRPGDTVWVKGSRAMQLDRIVAHLAGAGGASAPRVAYASPP
jgi:UDP-N-acetylmuramoyl-tripeptide--D-alanyl-D-alanine ligase